MLSSRLSKTALLSGLTALTAAGLALVALPSAQAQIVNYTDRPTFDAAVNSNVLEDFTPNEYFPITSGVLNSMTNQPDIGLTPGTILPGVTYSYPVNNPKENQFNIDGGGGFTGGFLDSIAFLDNSSAPLTVTFDKPTVGFGFDTNSLMGSSFTVMFHLADGSTPMETFNVAPTGTLQFFGFSDTVGIDSAAIAGNNVGNDNGFSFALDNFAFNSNPAAVPEASTTVSLGLLLCLGMGGVVWNARRRNAPSAE
jgi:hypothetical protein